jgi:molybdate-binding protein/DNA-binding XRE family transcriptional regulator
MALENRVRVLREARGLTQLELAEAIHVSRQTLSAIEAGRSEPAVTIALALARALGCPLEQLFSLEQPDSVEAEVDASFPLNPSDRVVLGSIAGRWVAHRLARHESANRAADGVLAPRNTAGPARVQLLRPPVEARDTLFVAGCAPALGLLAERTQQQARAQRVVWLSCAGGAALRALAARRVHVAGVHFSDPIGGQHNVPQVKEALHGRRVSLITLARWQAGLLAAAGNPHAVRGIEDLARPGLRLVAREPGSAARRLLEEQLKRARLPVKRILGSARVVEGHLEVAQAIALGGADTGIAMESAALTFGLHFVPLFEERFDLVVPHDERSDARVIQLLDTLSSASFRRELGALGGYDVSACGTHAAEVTGT